MGHLAEAALRTGLRVPEPAWSRAVPSSRPVDAYGVAVAKALATPPVAAERTLLGASGVPGAAVSAGLTADAEAVSRAAAKLGGGQVSEHAVCSS